MEKITDLENALKRIETLEKENKELKEELEYFKKRKASGRQKHNAKWMAIYNDFVSCYENGMAMVDIAKRNNISERSLYRYKAYYKEMRAKEYPFTDDFLSEPIPELPLENREELSSDIQFNIIEYKGYKASIRYDEEDKIFIGEVLEVSDSLYFHGRTYDELNRSFRDCIDNYLSICKQIKKMK